MAEGDKMAPALRFKGFSDAWEQRKLGKVLHERKMRKKISEETPLLAFAAGQGVIDRSERKTNNRDFLTKDSSTKTYLFTQYDDIVYNPSNLKYGAIDRNKHGQGVISPIYVTFETEEISSFIELIVRGDSFKQRALQYEEGTVTKRQSVKPESLLSLNIALPISKKEQQKIGDFFKQLDDTIALHQRKVSLFNRLKQTYLKRMFPQNEENMPVLRFADFSDLWDQRKLGEVVNFQNGRAYKQQELLESGKYRVLRVGNFNTNDRWYYSDLELEVNKYANSGDLLYLWATNFGPEIWDEEKVIYHYHIWKLDLHSSEVDKQYLYTWLITDKEKIKQTTNGTTMVHVTKGNMEQREFQLPINIKEQKKIGSFFKQLDDTIALHQSKLEKLKDLKQVLLAKLFV